MPVNRADVDSLLPLPPATFHILLALADQERHGYAIIKDVEERTGGDLRLSAGTLYRSIARMVDQRLIAEVPQTLGGARRGAAPLLPSDPLRHRGGRAEMARLSQLVRLARARGLTPETA